MNKASYSSAYQTKRPHQGKKPLGVLIIDDNPSDIRHLRKLLEATPRVHFEIKEAITFEHGCELAIQMRPDCIFLDDYLGPIHRAVETLPALRKIAQNSIICVASSSCNQGLEDDLLDGSALKYLDKDTITAADLRQLVGFVQVARCLV